MNLDRHIRETAYAWGLEIDHVYEIYDWLERRVPPYRRYYALTKILRKEYNSARKKRKKSKQLALL